MDQHIDTTKLEQLKDQLSKKPGAIPSVKVEVKPTQDTETPTAPTKEKTYWWLVAGSIVSGGLLGVFMATRKKTA